MNNNDAKLQALIKELLGLKEEYHTKSEKIIHMMKTCTDLFRQTNDAAQMKQCQKLKKQHDDLSHSYEQKLATLDKKISKAMELIK